MLLVTCNGCRQQAFTERHSDPDGAFDDDSGTSCGCCPESHHHGNAAAEAGAACRPLTITVVPGSGPALLLTGGN